MTQLKKGARDNRAYLLSSSISHRIDTETVILMSDSHEDFFELGYSKLQAYI